MGHFKDYLNEGSGNSKFPLYPPAYSLYPLYPPGYFLAGEPDALLYLDLTDALYKNGDGPPNSINHLKPKPSWSSSKNANNKDRAPFSILHLEVKTFIDPDDLWTIDKNGITFIYKNGTIYYSKGTVHYDVAYDNNFDNKNLNDLHGRINNFLGEKYIAFWYCHRWNEDIIDCLNQLLSKQLINKNTIISGPQVFDPKVDSKLSYFGSKKLTEGGEMSVGEFIANFKPVNTSGQVIKKNLDNRNLHLLGQEKNKVLKNMGVKPKIRKQPIYQTTIGDWFISGISSHNSSS